MKMVDTTRRILHITNDATLGGAQTLLIRLAKNWPPMDELHLAVLMDAGPLSPDYAEAFASVTYLGVGREPITVARGAIRLRALLRRLRPEIVHSHLLQADLANLAVAPRSVAKFSTVHTTGLSAADPRTSHWAAKAVAHMSHRFSSVIACTSECDTFMRDWGYKAPSQVVTNGVEMPALTANTLDSKVFLSVARNHPMKDHATLFRAFNEFAQDNSDWSLVCIGEGVTMDDLSIARAVEESGCGALIDEGRLVLDGPTHDVRGAMSRASALVISSSYGEAMPMAGLEAVASGVPVLATHVGGCHNVVSGEEWLASPGSATEIAEMLRRFSQLDQRERAVIRNRALSIGRQFAIGGTVEGYISAYSQEAIGRA